MYYTSEVYRKWTQFYGMDIIYVLACKSLIYIIGLEKQILL